MFQMATQSKVAHFNITVTFTGNLKMDNWTVMCQKDRFHNRTFAKNISPSPGQNMKREHTREKKRLVINNVQVGKRLTIIIPPYHKTLCIKELTLLNTLIKILMER